MSPDEPSPYVHAIRHLFLLPSLVHAAYISPPSYTSVDLINVKDIVLQLLQGQPCFTVLLLDACHENKLLEITPQEDRRHLPLYHITDALPSNPTTHVRSVESPSPSSDAAASRPPAPTGQQKGAVVTTPGISCVCRSDSLSFSLCVYVCVFAFPLFQAQIHK